NDAAVQDGAVADRAPGVRYGVLSRKAVHGAMILDVGALLDHDAPEVAPQAGTRPDVCARRDDHVADQHRARMHESAWIDDRRDAVDSVDLGHGRILTPWPRSSSPWTPASRRS